MSREDASLSTRLGNLPAAVRLELTELRRSNLSAVGMDLLFLYTTGFFAHHLIRGFWPLMIAAIPLVGLLYFGWRSSKPFFVAQVLTVVITVFASLYGLVPL